MAPLAEEHFSAGTFIRLEASILRAALPLDRGATAEAAGVLEPVVEPEEPIENLRGMLRGWRDRGSDSGRPVPPSQGRGSPSRPARQNVFRRELERVAAMLR